MEVGMIQQLTEECDKLTSSVPRALDIRVQPEKYVDALEARIKELEKTAKDFNRYIDEACAEFERLREVIKAIKTDVADLGYNLWEEINGWDI